MVINLDHVGKLDAEQAFGEPLDFNPVDSELVHPFGKFMLHGLKPRHLVTLEVRQTRCICVEIHEAMSEVVQLGELILAYMVEEPVVKLVKIEFVQQLLYCLEVILVALQIILLGPVGELVLDLHIAVVLIVLEVAQATSLSE